MIEKQNKKIISQLPCHTHINTISLDMRLDRFYQWIVRVCVFEMWISLNSLIWLQLIGSFEYNRDIIAIMIGNNWKNYVWNYYHLWVNWSIWFCLIVFCVCSLLLTHSLNPHSHTHTFESYNKLSQWCFCGKPIFNTVG